MSMTDTASGTEVEILNDLDWTPTEPCAFEECNQDAKWYALCPKDRSAETVCDQHHQEMLQWPAHHVLTFNGTCGHHVPIGIVIWEPYL